MSVSTGTAASNWEFRCGCAPAAEAQMMDMSTMSTGMMTVAGIYHITIFIFALLGIAASIKYLHS